MVFAQKLGGFEAALHLDLEDLVARLRIPAELDAATRNVSAPFYTVEYDFVLVPTAG